MVSSFYRRRSLTILLLCLAALPGLTWIGEQMPSNNNIETWLPRNSDLRSQYDHFCNTFGKEEGVLVAFQQPYPQPERIHALAGRLESLKEVSVCWTRNKVLEVMASNQVSEAVAQQRLVHLLTSPDDSLESLLVVLDVEQIRNRGETVARIREQLDYCGLNNAIVAGGPVVATQLDALGSRKNATLLFGLTLVICLLLLQVNVGCWKTSGALMLANVLTIELTLASISLSGQEMNFILSSLPVMVMVFTTAAAIHFIGHYRQARGPDAVGQAMACVIRPSAFATITTVIGLMSLTWSDVGPVPVFGIAAAAGTVFSFIVGVLITPAILVAVKYQPTQKQIGGALLERSAMYVVNYPYRILVPGLAVTAACAMGIPHLSSLINPLEFLPGDDPVLRDTLIVKEDLTSPTSIEAVVDFAATETSFVERFREIRRIESMIESCGNVCHTLSLADFFPAESTETALSPTRLMSANDNTSVASLMADGSRLWRISIRLHEDSPDMLRATLGEVRARCSGIPVTFTGIGPLIDHAQVQIFDGFRDSFVGAFVLISLVMLMALRSIGSAAVAMIPNLTPILLVFGVLGWSDFPIDIGIMMTASIALGLAVDGTFHFLFSYLNRLREVKCRYRAVRCAILQTGTAIISSAVISGTGLLALGLSPFRPTMRFGILMFCLLLTALIGDLLLLPAFLAIGAKRKRLKGRLPQRSAPQSLAA